MYGFRYGRTISRLPILTLATRRCTKEPAYSRRAVLSPGGLVFSQTALSVRKRMREPSPCAVLVSWMAKG